MTKPANHAFRLKMAKQKAEAFLRDEGMTTLPVDPFAIAASRDIDIKAKPGTAGGVSGMLLRYGDKFGIASPRIFRARASGGLASRMSSAIIF
jgi:hypothetical protein